jgi:hypothetical protein
MHGIGQTIALATGMRRELVVRIERRRRCLRHLGEQRADRGFVLRPRLPTQPLLRQGFDDRVELREDPIALLNGRNKVRPALVTERVQRGLRRSIELREQPLGSGDVERDGALAGGRHVTPPEPALNPSPRSLRTPRADPTQFE